SAGAGTLSVTAGALSLRASASEPDHGEEGRFSLAQTQRCRPSGRRVIFELCLNFHHSFALPTRLGLSFGGSFCRTGSSASGRLRGGFAHELPPRVDWH